MTLSAARRILIVAGLCAAALTGLVVSEDLARRTGQEILLPIEAVDPRSLLSGHYVQISPTERLAPGAVCPPGGESAKWLALTSDGIAYRVASGAASREAALLRGALAMRGRFDCQATEPPGKDTPGAPGWIRIDAGFSRFYASQRNAQRIEQVLRESDPKAFAIVSVGGDGRGRLKGLVLNGQRIMLTWL